MMRKYLVTIVFKPTADQAETLKDVKELVGEYGKVTGEEELALKKLSYEIAGTTEASFYQFKIEAEVALNARLNEMLRISDQVVRFMIKSVKEVKVAAEVVKAEDKSKKSALSDASPSPEVQK